MEKLSLYFAWGGILAGMLLGSVLGIFFYSPEWLGGYGSWTRRMLRLAHISLFGLALLNLALLFSSSCLGLTGERVALSLKLVIAGQITMPLICLSSAFRQSFRFLFFIPVLSLFGAVATFIHAGLIR